MKNLRFRVALFASVSLPFAVTAPAFAQSSDSEASDGTIIVTARRIEERLQDVPISIAVVDQDRLTKSNIVSSEDLAKIVPGLSVDSRYSSEQSTFAIRGFSQQLRTSSAVGTYFGEVVAPRGSGLSLQGGDGAGPGSLFDLQNVQVLKGPQGTLFGRNTTGGAVLLVPQKPKDNFGGYVEASYGNYDMKRIQAVVNAPLADWARLRLGIDRMVRDGYLRNGSDLGPSRFNDTSYTALRGSLVLDISPTLENYTIVSYLRSDSNGSVPQIFRANTSIVNGRPVGFGPQAVPQVTRLNNGDSRYVVENNLVNPRALTKQFQAINTTTWVATDNLTVRNIMSYSTFIQDLRQDIFGSNFRVPALGAYISSAFSFNPDGFHSSDQKNFTEELQFQGKGADGKLNYQFGLYYEHSTPGGLTAGVAPGVGALCLPIAYTTQEGIRCTSGNASPNSGTIEFINMAAYAQATYALTDQFKLTAGIRYTYDRSRGSARGVNLIFAPATPFTFVAPTLATTPTNPQGCATGYPIATNCVFSGRTSDQKPTWTLSAQYSPGENAMVYGTYSRGYKQGGVTPFSPAGVPFYGPERLDSFEVGTKLSFQGSVSGNLNIAGFYSKLSNQQILVGLQDTTGKLATATSVLNAGKSRIYGVEFDSQVRFGGMFRINAAATYLNTKIVSLNVPGFPEYDVKLFPAAGGPLDIAPKWTANLGGTFTIPTSDEIGKVELSALYRYSSKYVTGGGDGRATPVKQLDLNLDWRNVGGAPIDIALFATNVTKQFTYNYVLALFNSFGFDVGYVGQPRMYGARVKIRFGD
jgi:iron complex outermembrane receptor protein